MSRNPRHKPSHRSVFFICISYLLLLPGLMLPAQESQEGEPDPDAPKQSAAFLKELKQELKEAQELADQGNLHEASLRYLSWLNRNKGSEDYTSVLLRVLELQDNAHEALRILEIYGPEVLNRHDQNTIKHYQTLLLGMMGRIEEASALYTEIEAPYPMLYETALLLFEQGLMHESELRVKSVLSDPQDAELIAMAKHLLARIYAATGRKREAEKIFTLLLERYSDTSLSPVVMLSYFEFLYFDNREPEAEKLLKSLESRYPESPEFILARGIWEKSSDRSMSFAPSPSRYLSSLAEKAPEQVTSEEGFEEPLKGTDKSGPQETRPTETALQETGPQEALIQTGSFHVLENAQYMVLDLKKRGFKAEIREAVIRGDKYYRVVIGPVALPEESQKILIGLKEEGFEGMLLFDQ